MQRKVDKQCGAPFSAQYFIKTNDSALPRNQFVARLLPQFFENRIEQCVFELLRNDRAFQVEKTAGQA